MDNRFTCSLNSLIQRSHESEGILIVTRAIPWRDTNPILNGNTGASANSFEKSEQVHKTDSRVLLLFFTWWPCGIYSLLNNRSGSAPEKFLFPVQVAPPVWGGQMRSNYQINYFLERRLNAPSPAMQTHISSSQMVRLSAWTALSSPIFPSAQAESIRIDGSSS